MTHPPAFMIVEPEQLPDAPAYAYEFYAAIGKMALTWSRFEQHLEMLQRIILNINGSDNPMIINLKKKLDAMKRLFRDTKDVSHNDEAFRKLSERAKILGTDRNMMIHSNFIEFKDGSPPKIVLRYVTHPADGGMKVERGEFTIEMIHELTAAIYGEHINSLMPILKDAVNRQDPEKVRKALQLPDKWDGQNHLGPTIRL